MAQTQNPKVGITIGIASLLLSGVLGFFDSIVESGFEVWLGFMSFALIMVGLIIGGVSLAAYLDGEY